MRVNSVTSVEDGERKGRKKKKRRRRRRKRRILGKRRCGKQFGGGKNGSKQVKLDHYLQFLPD